MGARDLLNEGPAPSGAAFAVGQVKGPSRKLMLVWLAFCVLAAHAWNIQGPFHFDDSHTIANNPAMAAPWQSLGRYWTETTVDSSLPSNSGFRPMLFVHHLVAWQIGQGATWPFHVGKLIMHWLVAVTIFSLWRRLWSMREFTGESPYLNQSPWLPLLAATIFAVHPVTSECVQYISASSSLQCALFYLLAFRAHLQRDEKKGLRPVLIAVLCYAGAVLTKEEGVTLPAAAFAFEFIRSLAGGGRLFGSLGKAFRKTGYLWLAAVPLIGLIAYRQSIGSHDSLGTSSPLAYFMTQWRAYVWYMRQWFWPFDLNADNVAFGFSQGFRDTAVQQALALNLLLIAMAAVNVKRWPSLAFGLAWFYVTISPSSSFFVLAEPVNDRRPYLPLAMLGAAILPFVWEGMLRLWRSERTRRVLFAAIVGALAVGSGLRSRVWASDEDLWRDTVQKNPESGRAMNNLALHHMARGEMTIAIELLDRCVKAWPYYATCYTNQGQSHAFLKNDAQARPAFLRAIELAPRNPESHHYYALFLESRGELVAARAEYEIMHRDTRGTSVPGALGLARVLGKLGQKAEATTVLQDALKLYPANADIQTALKGLQ